MMALLTVTAFTSAPTIHFQTPMLAEFGHEFHAGAAAVGWVATLSFGGFLTGSLLLVPLGDRVDKRLLILGKLTGLILAVLAMAAAPTLPVLAAASFVTGVCATLSQDLLPLVAELAGPAQRGRAVGTILSGSFLGILFGRIVGGLMASNFGWRWTYVLSAVMLVAIAPPLIARLPAVPAGTRLAYRALMRSLGQLLRNQAELRRASAIQFLLGLCYGGFWATLAQMMETLHGLGPTAAGLVGIPGAAGILVARPAGRWMDRHGAAPVVTAGASAVLAAYVVFWLAGVALAAVFVGVALLDCGLRAAMVANQALVTGLDPNARSRSNTVLAVHIWGGNAIGALVATTGFSHAGWPGVCATGVAAAMAALLVSRRAG